MISLEKLKNINLSGNSRLKIDHQSLSGLKSIENIYINFEVLLNDFNKKNLINSSINLTISNVVMWAGYIINLI